MSAFTSLTIERAEELAEALSVRTGVDSIDVPTLLDALNDCKLALTHDTEAAAEAYWAYQANQAIESA